MRARAVQDDLQLRRIESAITRLENSSEQQRRRMSCLLAALQSEKAELLRFTRRPKPAVH